MMRKTVASLLLLTIAAASPAFAAQQVPSPAPEPNASRDCFHASAVDGFSYVDHHTVDLTVGARHYRLTTTWDARDLNWSEGIALRSTGDWICTGNGLGVDIVGGQPRQTYPITGIAALPATPAPAPTQQEHPSANPQ